MAYLHLRVGQIITLLLGVIFVSVSSQVFAQDATSDDYLINQQRTGVTEHVSLSDDYEIYGELGAPGVGVSGSDDYTFDHGTIWRTPGTLLVNIVDGSFNDVGSPSVAMGDITFSFNSQTATGTLGTGSQRIYWENFDAADTAGYSITIAATGGSTSVWDGPAATDYDFNDSSGATDGGDADSFGGQLTVDPSVGAITARVGYGSTTGISLGSIDSFEEGVVDSITLVNASGASDDYHAAYATGIDLSQAVPASQPADSYSLGMTITIA